MRRPVRAFVSASKEPAAAKAVGVYPQIWSTLCSFKNEEDKRYVDIIDHDVLEHICLAIEIGRMAEILRTYGPGQLVEYIHYAGRTTDHAEVVKIDGDPDRETHVLNLYRILHSHQLKSNKKYPEFLQGIHQKMVTPGMLFRKLYTSLHLYGLEDSAPGIVDKAAEVLIVLLTRAKTSGDAFSAIDEVVGLIYSLRRETLHQLDELKGTD